MSLWSGLTGEKLADLKGSWSMLWDILDFEGFYRRFNDGRLLTWSEEAWTVSGLATGFYLWDKQGRLIREMLIERRFRDIRLLDDECFVTFNCDDSLQIWDGERGELLQTCAGFAAKIETVQRLPDGQWLIMDHAKTLSLWQPTFNAEQPIQASHASRQDDIQVALFKDRILSYSLDSFPPRLWDANTGQLVAVLPAYDQALGARLNGIIPLSGERFLTWGHEPALHVYDSHSGDCLASMRDTLKPYNGQSTVWPLADDQVLCLFWDQRLCCLDLKANDFAVQTVIAQDVVGAFPISAERILYWTKHQALRLWNLKEHRDEYEYLTLNSPIKKVFMLSANRLGLLTEDPHLIELLDWRSGHCCTIKRATAKPVQSMQALSDQRIVLCGQASAEIWLLDAAPTLQFILTFDPGDQLKFMTELPNHHLLTQVVNHRASLWTVWHPETGNMMGSTILPNLKAECVASYQSHQTVLLKFATTKTQAHYFKILDWQQPDAIRLLSPNESANPKDAIAIQNLTRQHALQKGDWVFWGTSTDMPVEITKLGHAAIQCEWYGEPVNRVLALTDDGRLIGFGRKPILLQLYKGDQPVGFVG
jgi:WD40 repeat protein